MNLNTNVSGQIIKILKSFNLPCGSVDIIDDSYLMFFNCNETLEEFFDGLMAEIEGDKYFVKMADFGKDSMTISINLKNLPEEYINIIINCLANEFVKKDVNA